MSVRAVTFYEVFCDQCGATTGQRGDYAAWSDREQAEDDWRNGDGFVLDDGRTFCRDCLPADICPLAIEDGHEYENGVCVERDGQEKR